MAADPMTPERIAARREQIQAEHAVNEYGFGTECRCGDVVPCPVLADELEWVAEVERLREEERRQRETAEAATRGWKKDAAEAERITAGIRDLYTRCMQGARDNGEYYERTAAKYEQGKATVWDGVAEMLRELLPAVAETEARRG